VGTQCHESDSSGVIGETKSGASAASSLWALGGLAPLECSHQCLQIDATSSGDP